LAPFAQRERENLTLRRIENGEVPQGEAAPEARERPLVVSTAFIANKDQ